MPQSGYQKLESAHDLPSPVATASAGEGRARSRSPSAFGHSPSSRGHGKGSHSPSAREHRRTNWLSTHHCTDVPCVCAFLVCLVAMVYVSWYAFSFGNPRKLTHGFDFRGRTCGVSTEVAHQPLVFWCGVNISAGVPEALEFERPICVDTCPTDSATVLDCPEPSKTVVTHVDNHTIIVINQTDALQAQYVSRPHLSRYCVPDIPGNSSWSEALISDLNSPLLEGWEQVRENLGSIRRAWPVLIVAFALSLILSVLYMVAIRHFPKLVVYGALTVVGCGMLLTGVCFVCLACNVFDVQHSSPVFQRYPHEEAVRYSVVMGVCAVVFGLFTLLLLGFFSRGMLDLGEGCVEISCECLSSMPELLVQPFLDVSLRTGLLVFLACVFYWLLSVGEATCDSSKIGGVNISGLRRSITYTEEQCLLIVFFLFGCFWIMEFLHSLAQFVTTYSVVLWYYAPMGSWTHKRTPDFPLPQGYAVAMMYHFGTLALGSLLVGLLRLPVSLYGLSGAHTTDDKGERNHVEDEYEQRRHQRANSYGEDVGDRRKRVISDDYGRERVTSYDREDQRRDSSFDDQERGRGRESSYDDHERERGRGSSHDDRERGRGKKESSYDQDRGRNSSYDDQDKFRLDRARASSDDRGVGSRGERSDDQRRRRESSYDDDRLNRGRKYDSSSDDDRQKGAEEHDGKGLGTPDEGWCTCSSGRQLASCLVFCCDTFVMFISRNAFIDVSINSDSFMKAAHRSFMFLTSGGPLAQLFNGACVVFSFSGMVLVAFVTGWFVYLLTLLPAFRDHGSFWHVADPQITAFVASLLTFHVSQPFLVVLEQTSDTLLYCFDWNRQHEPESVDNHAAPALASLASDYVRRRKVVRKPSRVASPASPAHQNIEVPTIRISRDT